MVKMETTKQECLEHKDGFAFKVNLAYTFLMDPRNRSVSVTSQIYEYLEKKKLIHFVNNNI